MKRTSCLTAIALLLTSAPALPAETPRPTAQDNRIREVIYSDTQVFRIVGVFRSATQIVFFPASASSMSRSAIRYRGKWPRQKIRCSSNRANWRGDQPDRHHPFRTGNRTYTFELSARRGAIGARSTDTFFKVVFRYPREEAAAAQAAATQAAYTQAVALQAGAIRSALDLAVLEGKRNLNYSVQGSSAIQPSEITDNGQFTALRFPNQRELTRILRGQSRWQREHRPVRCPRRICRDPRRVCAASLAARQGRCCAFSTKHPDFYGRDPKPARHQASSNARQIRVMGRK
jgi:type IV secretion system protein VirB9